MKTRYIWTTLGVLVIAVIALLGSKGINNVTDQLTIKRLGFPEGYSAAGVSAALTGAGYTLDAMYGDREAWVFRVSEATEADRATIEAVIDGEFDATDGAAPASSQYGDYALIRATNATGSTVTANTVGYLDADRNFQTTTTLAAVVDWCVVVTGGDASAEIVVTTRGRITIAYAGTAPAAGDFLVTSTTAGAAATQTYVSPEIFAKALSAGSNGTVEALLLTQRRIVHKYGADYLLFNSTGATQTNTLWTGTVNDVAPTTSPVTVATAVGDSLTTISPTANTELAAIVIRNITRSNEALLASRSGSNFSFVSDTPLASWVDGDTLSAVSADVGSDFMTLQLKDTNTIPALATGLYLDIALSDSGAAGTGLQLHPEGTAYSALKIWGANAPVIGKAAAAQGFTPLVNRRFALQTYTASGTAATVYTVKLLGYIEAAP